jgi:hypothetical protein
MPLTVKFNLASYRAWLDCKYAVDKLKSAAITYSAWKVEWAGICSLLRTSIYLMGTKDAKSCLPEALKNQLMSDWSALYKNKAAYPLFGEFILKERNNILKEYEFSAYEAIIKPDGTSRKSLGLLAFMEDGEKETLLIRGGYYEGRQALDVLAEAVIWTEEYILNSIRKAGYDPEEQRYAGSLLPIVRKEVSLSRSALLNALAQQSEEKAS